jgi:Flp pilus assembly pilin Flp
MGEVMIAKLTALWNDENGFTAIEYGLIAAIALIAVGQLAAANLGFSCLIGLEPLLPPGAQAGGEPSRRACSIPPSGGLRSWRGGRRCWMPVCGREDRQIFGRLIGVEIKFYAGRKPLECISHALGDDRASRATGAVPEAADICLDLALPD